MQEIADALCRTLVESGVRQVGFVPDAGHAALIEHFARRDNVRSVVLTTEEEGIALCCGAWLGGQRAVLLLQSSGVGNCINMLAMVKECRFPLLMLVTMRGQWGEFNPWQVPMGQATADALRGAGMIVQPVDEAMRVVETVQAATRLAFASYRAVAVLIGQRVVGSKTFADDVPGP